jgi:hypothetical protein
MEKPGSTLPHAFNSPQVLLRFLLRLVLVAAFASLSAQPFGTAFGALLGLSAIFCAVVGAMRREPVFAPVLTHWDEAAGYAVIACIGHALA